MWRAVSPTYHPTCQAMQVMVLIDESLLVD